MNEDPDPRPPEPAAADPDLAPRLAAVERKLDTVAGALAAVAATQTELLELGRATLELLTDAAAAQGADLARALEALAGVTEALERSATRADDRLAAIRDAAAVPVADLQALLTARAEHADAQLQALLGRVEAALSGARALTGADADLLDQGPAAAEAAVAATDLAAFDAHVEELRNSVRSLSWQLPELAEALVALRSQVEAMDLSGPLRETAEDLAEDLRQHTDVALAGTIRLLDERFQGLRSAIVPLAAPPPAPMGFEAGAVMGTVQAAWSRLEQRLDHEFDELGHQLVEMDRRLEHALAAAEAAANRPVVTGEQLRKTASSVREAVQAAREQRRQRRGGPAPPPPKGLGPG